MRCPDILVLIQFDHLSNLRFIGFQINLCTRDHNLGMGHFCVIIPPLGGSVLDYQKQGLNNSSSCVCLLRCLGRQTTLPQEPSRSPTLSLSPDCCMSTSNDRAVKAEHRGRRELLNGIFRLNRMMSG
jgi:hypothetical protein